MDLEKKKGLAPQDSITNTFLTDGFWASHAQPSATPWSDTETVGSPAAGKPPFLSFKMTLKPVLSVNQENGNISNY